MKKRFLSLFLSALMMLSIFPASALAAEAPESGAPEETSYYTAYSAIGDSIAAGFSQVDYAYTNGFDMMQNITDCPDHCYASLVGDALNSAVYNLGKCGCDSSELLDILTNTANDYFGVYHAYIGESGLITLEIGSNDLLMAEAEAIVGCLGDEYAGITHQQLMAIAEPMLTGDLPGIVNAIKTITGIQPTPEEIEAIQAALSDEAMTETFSQAFSIFRNNFPQIVALLGEISPDSELVILNYYNPYAGMTLTWGETAYHVGDVIQVFTDEMNAYTSSFCLDEGYLCVDIQDIQSNIGDPHPSYVGHAQIASRIVSALMTTVTATAGAGGTITPSGQIIVDEGGTLTLTVSACAGFEISDVLVDGVSVGAVETYTFTDLNEDHTVKAAFSLLEPSVPEEKTTYYETYTALGDSIAAGFGLEGFTGNFVNPASGYVAGAAYELGVENTHNLAMLGYDTADLLNILTDDETNPYYDMFREDLAASDLISIQIGSNDLTMTMLGIVLDRLGFDMADMTPEDRAAMVIPLLNGLTLESIFQNLQLFFDREISPEQVDAVMSALQTENVNAAFQTAYERFTVNWDAVIRAVREINPDAAVVAIGYYNASSELNFTYNDVEYRLGEAYNTYLGLMNDYITNGSGEAGEYLCVIPTDIQLISAIGAISIDPHPTPEGHATIASLLVDAVLNDITAAASAGGTISPEGTATVAYGLTPNYTYTYCFAPDADKAVIKVLVDGENIGTPASYTFSAVSGDHTLSVVFTGGIDPLDPDQPDDGNDSDDNTYRPVLYTYYSIGASSSEGGCISPNGTRMAVKGSCLTYNVTPDAGYEIDYIMVDGERIAPTNTVPINNISANHSIYAAFKVSAPDNPYSDIGSTDWFYSGALKLYTKGIMTGITDSDFAPFSSASRAMVVLMLYRLENKPSVAFSDVFFDVAQGEWYTDAVLWAASRGIVNGFDCGRFGPNDTVTREQLVKILFQYAEYKGFDIGITTDLGGYPDHAAVSDWADAAMRWAVSSTIIIGTEDSFLKPGDTASRAEIAVIISRFLARYYHEDMI